MCAFLISLVIILYFYASVLYPIIDGNLNFFDSDFTNRILANGENVQKNYFLYTFDDQAGASSVETPSLESNRFFLLGGGMRAIFGVMNLSYSQTFSIIILISILMGCYGLYRITDLFERDVIRRSFIILPVILFYYLNLWSAERLVHFWIWVAYAAVPIFLWLGLSFVLQNNKSYIIFYSIVYAFFGNIPHAFIFFSVIHIFLVTFSLARKEKLKKIFIFSIIPISIYFLVNMPFLLIFSISEGYPIKMSIDQLAMLSRYGQLINALTFSNYWWPQVPLETIFDNVAFRVSSLGIIICVLTTLLVSKRFDKNELKMTILSFIFFLVVIFVAQGTNNPLISSILQMLGEYRLLDLVAPLREWARISILIPIFLVLIFIVCSSKLKNKEIIAVYIFLTLVVVNVFSSPANLYLNKVYSPVYVPEEYYDLNKALPLDHKTLYIYPSQAEEIYGNMRYAWNPDKSVSKISEYGIGSTYPDNSDFSKLMKNKELPPTLLEALNIKYVIKRTDILGASNFKVEYKDLDNTKLGYLTLCVNKDDVKPFLIYSSGILVNDDMKDIYSLARAISKPSVAPIRSSASDTFALYDFSSYALYQGLTQAGKAIVVAPFDFSYRHNPSVIWSKGTTNDVLHTEWHPYLEEFNIENWETDYGRGLVFTWANNSDENDLRMTFEVNNASDYHLLIRYMENSRGGLISVFLDGLEISTSSLNQLNRFVWKDLGEFHLENGRHSIVLRNVAGFNAVNLFSLVQGQDLFNIENGIEETFKNKTMIYILEGESDLYYENANVEKSPQASYGEDLALSTNGKAWQDIEIVREGFYRSAFLLNGSLKVTFDNTTFFVKSDGINYTYLDPVYLSEGLHRIQIERVYAPSGGSCNLDVVWIYLANSSLTLEELFNNNEVPAMVKNYTKVDPTLWRLQIDSTKPFILSFSEAYDPSWEARVYKDGKLVERAQPTVLYNFINGFRLNTTGTNLEVQIVYTQQERFEAGLIFTGLILAFILFYVLYDWRRTRKLKGSALPSG